MIGSGSPEMTLPRSGAEEPSGSLARPCSDDTEVAMSAELGDFDVRAAVNSGDVVGASLGTDVWPKVDGPDQVGGTTDSVCSSSRCPFPIGSLERARRSHGGPFWGIGVDGVLSSDVEAGDRARWWRERRMVGGGGQSRLLRRVEWLAVETAARARPRRRPRARRHLPLLGPQAD